MPADVLETSQHVPPASRGHTHPHDQAILTTAEERETISTLMGSLPISVIAIQEIDVTAELQLDPANNCVAVNGRFDFLGAVIFSERAKRVFDDAKEKIEFLCKARPEIFIAAEKREDHLRSDLYAWIIGLLSKRTQQSLKDAHLVRRALVTIRREHEDTLEKFALLEKSAEFYGTPRVIERLFMRPAQASVKLQASRNHPGRVRQLVPIQTLGLSGVEIYLGELPRDCIGNFLVNLIDEERGTVHSHWAIEAQHLVPGKNLFLLEKALTSRDRDPTIEICWDGDTPIQLLLSAQNPITTFCASLDGDKRIDAPIAVRVLASSPGSVIGTHNQGGLISTGTSTGSARRHTYALGSNELQNVIQLHPKVSAVSWKPVEFRPAQSDILVHPFTDDTTVALIRGVNVRNLKHLSALVLLDNLAARPVECSLGTIKKDTKLSDHRLLPTAWTRIEPNVLTEVRGTIQSQEDDVFDMFLATRMADGADSDLAWAFFKRIEVTV